MRKFAQRAALLALTAAISLTSACVYRQDILQGNVLLDREVNQIETGMTRNQVRFILGTPMVATPFQPDTWEYLLYVDSQYEARDQYRRVSLQFEGDTLVNISKTGFESRAGDAVPKAGFEETVEENRSDE